MTVWLVCGKYDRAIAAVFATAEAAEAFIARVTRIDQRLVAEEWEVQS